SAPTPTPVPALAAALAMNRRTARFHPPLVLRPGRTMARLPAAARSLLLRRPRAHRPGIETPRAARTTPDPADIPRSTDRESPSRNPARHNKEAGTDRAAACPSESAALHKAAAKTTRAALAPEVV